jgi:hypothetical protein
LYNVYDADMRRMRRLWTFTIVAAVVVVLAFALGGCAPSPHLVSSRGRWEPIPDPVNGKVYSCCWYPHGFYRWVPDALGIAPDRVQER